MNLLCLLPLLVPCLSATELGPL
ncbi:MAG: hypothetical protein QG656_829, partial [Candidatus Hydrogenedentes bacterium]|nr:hypothetical protein [Candidatus Hydrogenedentota bacterium]